jgi:hypothetical protein
VGPVLRPALVLYVIAAPSNLECLASAFHNCHDVVDDAVVVDASLGSSKKVSGAFADCLPEGPRRRGSSFGGGSTLACGPNRRSPFGPFVDARSPGAWQDLGKSVIARVPGFLAKLGP